MAFNKCSNLRLNAKKDNGKKEILRDLGRQKKRCF